MGTDWRDNDPVVEPIVEIYQGDRMSYEKEGAPRAGYDPKAGRKPANIAGWFPKGFVNLALQKGYKLGFQASSDHWSTHISYCVDPGREGTTAETPSSTPSRSATATAPPTTSSSTSAAATRSWATSRRVRRRADVRASTSSARRRWPRSTCCATARWSATIKPATAPEYKGEWTDPKPQAGTHYYYIRVLQTDGEIAWASPMWVTRK